MKILHTGRGTSGSWQCRGVQMGWHKAKATKKDMAKADIIVLVKRPYHGFLEAVRASGKPWIWDVVDAYPQPQCTAWGRSKAIHWFKTELRKLNPDGVIFPNQRMADDCRTDTPSTVIYHHHRIDIQRNPIREQVKVVGYEGSPKYLGKWQSRLLKECADRGWNLQVNHGAHSDWDICVAFRDTEFNGYVQRHWKSNVKLANAHGSGTPFIGPTECGYMETDTGLEQWVDSPGELRDALDRLTEQNHRETIQEAFLANAIKVEGCQRQLTEFAKKIMR